MTLNNNNNHKLSRKRKALIDAKRHEAKSRRKLNEKKQELDAQYTALKAQRAIYERLQAEVQSAERERDQCANIVSILQIAQQPSIATALTAQQPPKPQLTRTMQAVVSPHKPLGYSGSHSVSTKIQSSATDAAQQPPKPQSTQVVSPYKPLGSSGPHVVSTEIQQPPKPQSTRVVNPYKPLGSSRPHDVSSAEIQSAIDDDSLMEEYLQMEQEAQRTRQRQTEEEDKDGEHEEERLGDDDKEEEDQEEEDDDDFIVDDDDEDEDEDEEEEGDDEDDDEVDDEGALARPRNLRKSTRSTRSKR